MDGLFHRKKARFPLRAVLNRTKDVRTGLNEIRGVKMGKTVTCLSERLGHGIDQFAKTGDWTKISRFDSRRSKNTRNRRGIQARRGSNGDGVSEFSVKREISRKRQIINRLGKQIKSVIMRVRV